MPTTRVRGILIEAGKLILIKRVKSTETYYVFPGGGVEEGESLEQALLREMKEELGVEVKMGELLTTQSFERKDSPQTEYFYLCTMVGGVLGTGDGPEFQPGSHYEGTHEVVKISLDSIKDLRLLPLEVRDLLVKRLR
jgi:ADP-ribose pyrophosphatase YjhB (NUDIX family)